MAGAGDGSGHTPLTPEWTPAPRASHYPWQGDRPAAGPAKSRNPRNPQKFTKSSVYNRLIVSETDLNQQRQPLSSSDQRTLTVDEIEVASSLNFSILIECSLLNACESVDFVSITVFRRIRQFRDCLRWI